MEGASGKFLVSRVRVVNEHQLEPRGPQARARLPRTPLDGPISGLVSRLLILYNTISITAVIGVRMTSVFFDPPKSDEQWRRKIYDGEIIILSPTPEMLAVLEHTRGMVEEAFAPLDPQRVHESLPVEKCVEILAKLKPSYIHHPRTKELIQRALVAFGCSPEQTYQDVPRLRCAFPKDYLTTGIAYAHHPHRDTWYSAPSCQFNWWSSIYEFVPENGMAFHPPYWGRSTKNGSKNYNYYRWNAEGRKNAAQHIGVDTRVQPHAEEPLELEPEVRYIPPPGGVIVFSAAQLHSTVSNTTNKVRWSIDFRTVNIDDVKQ